MNYFRYEWFHGFLSTSEAEGLLKGQAPGTFLVRLSKSSSNAFVISCLLNPSQPVIHTILQKDAATAPFVVEDANGTRQQFHNLLQVLQRFNLLLPLTSSVSRLG